jgi:hypothetical protein
MKTYNDKFQSFTQTYQSPTKIEFLGSTMYCMIVKEFSADGLSFKYAAYFYQAAKADLPNLGRITIDPPNFPAGDPRAGLVFDKLIQVASSGYLVMSFKSSTRT